VRAEEAWRLFTCALCATQVRLCPSCDHGQRYCGRRCAAEHRRRQQREASRAYQATRRGAHLHAARMQRYRDRQRQECKFPAPIVTQHPWAQGSPDAIPALSTPARSPTDTHQEDRTHAPLSSAVARDPSTVSLVHNQTTSGCSRCGRPLSRFARLDALRVRLPRHRRAPRMPTGPP
jgi:hypothetical protein